MSLLTVYIFCQQTHNINRFISILFRYHAYHKLHYAIIYSDSPVVTVIKIFEEKNSFEMS